MLTYGDGVADIDIHELLKLHEEKGKTATISIVNVSQRSGSAWIRNAIKYCWKIYGNRERLLGKSGKLR